MFLHKIKELPLKKIVAKKWTEVKHSAAHDFIRKVGIILDETSFLSKDDLIHDLIQQGIKRENIKILVFRDPIKKKEEFDYPVFSYNDFKWSGAFESDSIRTFLSQYYDLLINYFDMDKAALLLTSQLTQSGFKVGFASVNKKANDLIITTSVENHKEFTTEMFKYLRILNKI